MKKRVLAVLVALIMASAVMPFLYAETASDWTVPEGYNEHDYNKITSFLELMDENGNKNGSKLSASYDPNDPSTWGKHWDETPYFVWSQFEGEYHLMQIAIPEAYEDTSKLVGTLDLSNFTKLVSIFISGQRISALNVANDLELTSLECAGNCLSELNVSTNVNLQRLSCGNNDIESLDTTGNPNLLILAIAYMPIDAIDLSHNTALQYIECSGTPLTSLDLSNQEKLLNLFCANIGISEIDLSKNVLLQQLYINNNTLVGLDVSHNTELIVLHCENTGIDELDLSNNTALGELWCGYNEMTGLDVSHNTQLSNLECEYNSISELDVSMLPDLSILSCYHNPIASLDVSNNNKLISLQSQENPLQHEIIFDNNDNFAITSINSDGNGAVGVTALCLDPMSHMYLINTSVIPDPGYSFTGWYDGNGDYISDMEDLCLNNIGKSPELMFIARFSPVDIPSLPGDVDGSGTVEATDAIMALRCAMGILELTPEQFEAADMDGSGTIALDDAITILRTAMGLLG